MKEITLKSLRLIGLCIVVFILAIPVWRTFIATNWNALRSECMLKVDSASGPILSNEWNYDKCSNVIHGADVQ